jgi:hypothetical protein
LRAEADALAASIAAAAPACTVLVADGDDGVAVTVSGNGLQVREFGSAGAPPDPVIGPSVAERGPAMAKAVQAAFAAALEGR